MIRHCVFIRFRPEVREDEKTAIFAEISALKEQLPGLLAVHIGTNISPEIGMDKGHSDGFIVDFTDAAARDTYLEDPDHRRTGAKIVAAAAGGIQGVFVYDLEIPD